MIDPQTPGQALIGQPQVPTGQPPQQQTQAPQPAPTPQQADAVRHHALGKAASFLFGAPQVDPQTGEAVRQRPGQLFRSSLAGALLGGAMGSEGPRAGSGVGGFLSGVVERITYGVST